MQAFQHEPVDPWKYVVVPLFGGLIMLMGSLDQDGLWVSIKNGLTTTGGLFSLQVVATAMAGWLERRRSEREFRAQAAELRQEWRAEETGMSFLEWRKWCDASERLSELETEMHVLKAIINRCEEGRVISAARVQRTDEFADFETDGDDRHIGSDPGSDS
jgi:hypothetical protein